VTVEWNHHYHYHSLHSTIAHPSEQICSSLSSASSYNAGSGGRITRDQFAQLYSEVRGKQNVEERAVDAVFELIKAKSSGKEDLL
jgi:hypothetical protein